VARPRQHTDDELLHLVGESLARSGRAGWTLAEVGADAGVHAATLVKRFGSKRGLLLALSQQWVAGLVAQQQTNDPYAELLEWVSSLASPRAERERALADIAMLMEDLVDEQLSTLLARGWKKQVEYLAALMKNAQATGRLRRAPDPDLAATAMLDVANGAALRSAAYPNPREIVDPRAMAAAILESWQ